MSWNDYIIWTRLYLKRKIILVNNIRTHTFLSLDFIDEFFFFGYKFGLIYIILKLLHHALLKLVSETALVLRNLWSNLIGLKDYGER